MLNQQLQGWVPEIFTLTSTLWHSDAHHGLAGGLGAWFKVGAVKLG